VAENTLLDIVGAFLADKMTAPEFERQYMHEWQRCRDEKLLSAESLIARGAYNQIFTALDCYCSDPQLRGPKDIDEHQLREEVVVLFAVIKRERHGR